MSLPNFVKIGRQKIDKISFGFADKKPWLCRTHVNPHFAPTGLIAPKILGMLSLLVSTSLRLLVP